MAMRIKPDQIFIIGLTLLDRRLTVYLLLLPHAFRQGDARDGSDNPELAEASGIRTDRVRMGTWAAGRRAGRRWPA